MPERDLFRRVLEHLLPWHNVKAYDRERELSVRAIDRANRVVSLTDRVLYAYRQYEDVVRR